MPYPIIISSFIIGVCIWLLLYSIIIDSEDLAGGLALLIFIAVLVGLLLWAGYDTVKTKTIEATEVEFYKFKSYTVLIVNDKLYYSNKAKTYNSISEKSKIEILINYNSYRDENDRSIIIDGKKFEQ